MTEKRVALIIASYQYEDSDLQQLVAPAQDAEALARALQDPAIGGFEVQTLLNEPSYKVGREIEAFFADRKRDDLLLLYFSGHGIKDEGGRLYFAASDTHRKTLRTTAISADLVNDVMRHSRSRRQVLLLDCCYSGAFARGMVAKSDGNVDTRDHFAGRGRVVLTASDAMQYAFEGDEVKGEGMRSVFTQALVQGLETGKADLDEDGRISLDELYDYVYECVTDETPQQRPMKWAFDVQGEIVIARNPRPVTKPVTEPAAPPFESKPVIEISLRLRGMRLSRRAALLGVLALLLAATSGVLVQRLSSILSTPDDLVRVGIASFVGCPQVSDALPDAIAAESEAKFYSLDEIQNSAAARAYTERDMVIWGQCAPEDQLTMHLEILTARGPEEVIEVESVTAQTLALDPDHVARLGRAAINYLHGDYDEAAGNLSSLQQEASTPSEQAELAFLLANSLLFAERYEEAISAYDGALEYERIRTCAYNNRGVAGMNWALQLDWRDNQPSDAELQAAIDDLTKAIETSEDQLTAALAYYNRGMARSLVAGDYDLALADCEQAIAQAPEQPLGYVCRAAARLMPLLEETTCNQSEIQLVRQDLAEAHNRDHGLADLFFWRGYVALLQAEECDTIEQDKQEHWQDAQDDFQVFLELVNQQPVQLAIDRYMLKVHPPLAQSP